MHLEFLLEEPSAQVALGHLVPVIVTPTTTYRFHVFRGKSDLMISLPRRLAGYRHWLPEDYMIVVLVDADEQDCAQLKDEMERCARQAGLHTPSTCQIGDRVQVVNRIAVHELEAWYWGDTTALHAAFPRLPVSMGLKAKYRNPDDIVDTWEALERELQRKGYYPAGLQKADLAAKVAPHMRPEANRSHSFRVFRDAVTRYGTPQSQDRPVPCR
jgi:hypothetical protein